MSRAPLVPVTIEANALLGIVTGAGIALAGAIGFLTRELLKNYAQQIRDLTLERDRFKMIVEQQRIQLDRNAEADSRLLQLVEHSGRRRGTPSS